MKQSRSLPYFSAPGWADSKGAAIILIVAYLFIAAIPVLLAFFLAPESGHSPLHEVGKAAGLMGFSLLVLQVALSARLKRLGRPFGLDAVMTFHRNMAVFAFLLLIAHPILMSMAAGSYGLFSSATGWQVNLGKAALVLLIMGVLFALFFYKLRIDYNVWRFLHKGMVFILILGFTHGLVTGGDFASIGMKVCWVILFGVAVGLFLYRNGYVPWRGRRRFQVESITPETHDVWTIRMIPEDGKSFSYQPGQFQFLKLIRPDRLSEEHPFTISSSPSQEGSITATIKESGNYTNTIGQTKAGDKALLEGPFGRFSFVHYDVKKFLFIAGGVGITPLMSMIRFLRDTEDPRAVRLIYGNKQQSDIIFPDELKSLPSHMKAIHILSQADSGWNGPRGYITDEIIKQYAGDILDEVDVFLCGPPLMTKIVCEALRTLNVKDSRIHFERFTLP